MTNIKIDKSVYIAGIIAVAVIVVALIISGTISKFSPYETITIEGVSSVSVLPDEVAVYFSVETLRDSAEDAKSANSEIMNNVMDALIGSGFDREDFETQNFDVNEQFDWSENGRKSLGFKATHSIVVRMSSDDEDLIGAAIDAAVDNGALLNYINFELSTELENKYKAKALRLAAEDARIKGEAVADGLGMRLGKVLSTQSSDFGYSPWVAYREELSVGATIDSKEIATDINVGERDVSARISATYKIL